MDMIFNLFKIKFTKLDELIERTENVSIGKNVKLFINLEPVLKKLISANVEEYMKVRNDEKILELISNIVNLAAHYRLFFSKNKIYSKVYIYIGFPFNSVYKNKNINPKYRDTYTHRFVKNTKSKIFVSALENAFNFCKTILEFIDGVYLIYSKDIEPSMIPLIIHQNDITEMNEFSNSTNIILSNDKYDYQYVNKGFYIFRPKKENSYIITKDNLIHTVKLEEKIVNKLSVDSNFYSFILSLLGDRYRDIPKIKRMGLSNLLKLLVVAMDKNLISQTSYNINLLAPIVKSEYRELLITNFYTTDIDAQYKTLNIKDIHYIILQLKDKFDNVSLKRINNDYFRFSPLMLHEITSSTNLKSRPTKNIFTGK